MAAYTSQALRAGTGRGSRTEEETTIDLHMETAARDGWTVLSASGELDLYTGPQLRDAVLAATEAGERRIALDLNGVTFVDSTGLGVLVACLKRVREREGELILIAPESSPLTRLLSLTGLQEILPLHADLADAPG